MAFLEEKFGKIREPELRNTFRRKQKSKKNFGQIELIRIEGNYIKRLDINDEDNRHRLLTVSNNDHLNDIFYGL